HAVDPKGPSHTTDRENAHTVGSDLRARHSDAVHAAPPGNPRASMAGAEDAGARAVVRSPHGRRSGGTGARGRARHAVAVAEVLTPDAAVGRASGLTVDAV